MDLWEKIKATLWNAEIISKAAALLHFAVAVGLVLFSVGFGAAFRGSRDLIAFTVADVLLLLLTALLMALMYAGVFWFVAQTIQRLKRQQSALEQQVEQLDKANAMLRDRTDILEQTKDALEQGREQLQPRTGVDYRLRIEGGIVKRGKEAIALPLKEFMLLECLMQKAGGLCAYEEIINCVWADVSDNSSYTNQHVHALVRRLRKTLVLPLPASHDYIRSFDGRGYGFVQWTGAADS